MNTKDLFDDQENYKTYYKNDDPEKEIVAYGWGYKTSDTEQDPTFDFDDDDPDEKGLSYVVISTSGQWITSGTKKDGDDFKIKVKNDKLIGIYREE